MLLLRFPRVYRPQADTWLLSKAMREARIRRGARVLDLCTGSGALAIAAAKSGAGEVTAVDRCRRAVASTRLNARLRRLSIRVHRGDLTHAVAEAPFDVVLANPPYVPCESGQESQGAWDAGPDGRRFLDRLCANAFTLLTPGGMMLLVHSSLCGVDDTLASLRQAGLKVSVVARSAEPFGPVLRGRVRYLEDAGLILPGQRYEELVVIRADRTEPTK